MKSVESADDIALFDVKCILAGCMVWWMLICGSCLRDIALLKWH